MSLPNPSCERLHLIGISVCFQNRRINLKPPWRQCLLHVKAPWRQHLQVVEAPQPVETRSTVPQPTEMAPAVGTEKIDAPQEALPPAIEKPAGGALQPDPSLRTEKAPVQLEAGHKAVALSTEEKADKVPEPAQKSDKDVEIEMLRNQMAALQARLTDANPGGAVAKLGPANQATSPDLALDFIQDIDGVPMVDDELREMIRSTSGAGSASSGSALVERPDHEDPEKVNFVTHKNEGARMGRFMDSQEGSKFPHMMELWKGTPAETW